MTLYASGPGPGTYKYGPTSVIEELLNTEGDPGDQIFCLSKDDLSVPLYAWNTELKVWQFLLKEDTALDNVTMLLIGKAACTCGTPSDAFQAHKPDCLFHELRYIRKHFEKIVIAKIKQKNLPDGETADRIEKIMERNSLGIYSNGLALNTAYEYFCKGFIHGKKP